MRLLGTPILGLALLDRSRPVNNRGVPLGPRRGENSGHRNLTQLCRRLQAGALLMKAGLFFCAKREAGGPATLPTPSGGPASIR